MHPFHFKVEFHHSVLTYIGPLNAILLLCTWLLWYTQKGQMWIISVAEALVHGPVISKIFI